MKLVPALKSISIALWVLAGLALMASLLSYFFTGTHALPGGIRLRIDGFEKPLVMAILLAGAAFFCGISFPRLATPPGDGFSRRGVFALMAVFVGWFFAWNALRCATLTIGYDMGTYSNILFNTSQGRWFFESHGRFNMLGEHFMVTSAIFAPLLSLWRDPMALVLAQGVMVSLSILAIHQLAWIKTRHAAVAMGFVALYLLSPFTHRIMMDPYRPITMAIPVFLWALVALESGRRVWFWGLVIFSFGIQENTPIFLVGLGAYLFLFRKGERLTGAALALLSFAVLTAVMTVVMPHFYGSKRLEHMNVFWHGYGGANFAEILWNIVKNPWPLLGHTLAPFKLFQGLFLASMVGFLCLTRLRYVVLFILPVLFYQMTDFGYMNNFSRHYSADPLVGIFYGAILAVSENGPSLKAFFEKALSRFWGKFTVVVLLLALFTQIPDYKARMEPAFVREARSFLAEIPGNASVSCSQFEFYAPLAFRKDVMTFPTIRDTDFVFITRKELSAYPAETRALAQNPRYALLREGKYALLYRRVEARPGVPSTKP